MNIFCIDCLGSEICKYGGKQSWWIGSKETLQRNQQLINKEFAIKRYDLC